MRRRTFIAALGSAAAWPVVVQAQQPAVPVVGYLNTGSRAASSSLEVAFRGGLGSMGFVEGRNVAIDYRYTEYQNDRLPELAAELVRRRVAVIVALGIDAALVAKPATTTIPIVFDTGGDPVALGLVASLNRPGANLTGGTFLAAELATRNWARDGTAIDFIREHRVRSAKNRQRHNP